MVVVVVVVVVVCQAMADLVDGYMLMRGCMHACAYLEVPVDDPAAVEVLDGEEDLGGEEAGGALREGAVALEVHEEVPAVVEVRDEVELGAVLEGEAEADDERVLRLAKDGTLQLGAVDVPAPDDLRLVDHLWLWTLSGVVVVRAWR